VTDDKENLGHDEKASSVISGRGERMRVGRV